MFVVLFILVLTFSSYGLSYGELPLTEEDAIVLNEELDRAIKYSLKIEGLPNKILNQFLNLSVLNDKQNEQDANVIIIKRRLKEDIRKIKNLLIKNGYYKSSIGYNFINNNEAYTINIDVDKGPLFVLDQVSVIVKQNDQEIYNLETIIGEDINWKKIHGLFKGQVALTDYAINSAKKIENYFLNKGFPKIKVDKPELFANTENSTINLKFLSEIGNRSKFNQVYIKGLKGVKEHLVENKIKWNSGDFFDNSKLESMKSDLIDTGLFNTVEVNPAPKDDLTDVEVLVDEAKFREVGASIRYNTAQKLGVKALWMHKNVLGAGERIELNYDYSKWVRGPLVRLAKPNLFYVPKSRGKFIEKVYNSFWSRNSEAILDVSLQEYITQSYNRKGPDICIKILNKDNKKFWVNSELEYENAEVYDYSAGKKFNLMGGKIEVNTDLRNKDRISEKGWFASISVAPFFGDFEGIVYRTLPDDENQFGDISKYQPAEKINFTKGSMKIGYVYPFGQKMEGKISLESNNIFSSYNFLDLPANHRIYCGGVNSVRGYGPQMAEDIATKDDRPKGGKHLIGGSLELKYKINENLAAVGFVDMAKLYRENIAANYEQEELAEKVRVSNEGSVFWGYGLGVRYYSSMLGVLSADIALPGKWRQYIDSNMRLTSFQFYITIQKNL